MILQALAKQLQELIKFTTIENRNRGLLLTHDDATTTYVAHDSDDPAILTITHDHQASLIQHKIDLNHPDSIPTLFRLLVQHDADHHHYP